MIEVGNMVRSKYRLSNGKQGNLGLVMDLRNTAEEARVLAHLYYPKTRTFGWVHVKDMEVVSANA
tara:strand:+ start:248 stop:442 length:195 start_codon:yes stop_codon:yes gene_type:complete